MGDTKANCLHIRDPKCCRLITSSTLTLCFPKLDLLLDKVLHISHMYHFLNWNMTIIYPEKSYGQIQDSFQFLLTCHLDLQWYVTELIILESKAIYCKWFLNPFGMSNKKKKTETFHNRSHWQNWNKKKVPISHPPKCCILAGWSFLSFDTPESSQRILDEKNSKGHWFNDLHLDRISPNQIHCPRQVFT